MKLTDVVTPEQVFGSYPWIAGASGTGPTGQYSLNPQYFANEDAANKLAAMLNGAVYAFDALGFTPGTPFLENQPRRMVAVQLKNADNPPTAATISLNAGLTITYFDHGMTLGDAISAIQHDMASLFTEVTGKAIDQSTIAVDVPGLSDGIVAPNSSSIPGFCRTWNPNVYGVSNPGGVDLNPFVGHRNTDLGIASPDGRVYVMAKYQPAGVLRDLPPSYSWQFAG